MTENKNTDAGQSIADNLNAGIRSLRQLGNRAAPAGFSFRVMERIVASRLRQAERRAQRQSALVATLMTITGGAALLLLVQLEWASAHWLPSLSPALTIWAGLGLLALVMLDMMVETRWLPSPDTNPRNLGTGRD